MMNELFLHTVACAYHVVVLLLCKCVVNLSTLPVVQMTIDIVGHMLLQLLLGPNLLLGIFIY